MSQSGGGWGQIHLRFDQGTLRTAGLWSLDPKASCEQVHQECLAPKVPPPDIVTRNTGELNDDRGVPDGDLGQTLCLQVVVFVLPKREAWP